MDTPDCMIIPSCSKDGDTISIGITIVRHLEDLCARVLELMGTRKGMLPVQRITDISSSGRGSGEKRKGNHNSLCMF